MSNIPALHTFTPNSVAESAKVNDNFGAIRSAFNTYAVQTDVATTITVTHTFSASQTFSAGATFGAGLSGTTATFSGAVSAAGLTSSSGLTVSSGTTAVQALTATSVTAASGSFSSAVTVTGIVTTSGGSAAFNMLDRSNGNPTQWYASANTVYLNFNGADAFSVSSAGAVTATSFHGNGAGLTDIPASAFTGAFNDVTLGASGGTLSFFGGTLRTKQTVSGNRLDGSAMEQLMTALAHYGLVVNNTTV